MAFIPVPGSAAWAVRFLMAGSQMEITGAMIPGHAPVTNADMVNMATVLDTWARASLMTELSSAIEYTAVHLEAQDSASAPVFDLVAAVPVPGDIASPPVTANSAFVVTKQTLNRGRGFRGRWFVPGLPESGLLSPKEWAGSVVTTMQSIFTSLINDSNSFAVPQVVLHRHQSLSPLNPGIFVNVTSIRANPRVGSQRRRTGGF